MNFKQILLVSLKKPANLPETLSPLKLKLHTIVEGAFFVAATTSLLNSSLDKFSGMFSFALWDRKKRSIYLVRDRFGEKPLYYGFIGRKQN